MTGHARRTLPMLSSALALALALALLAAGALAGSATASAASVTLRCAGRGDRDRDSSGTVVCAGSPARGRTVAGVVRNDAGQPVAARVSVTYKSWTVAPGGGYYVRARETKEIVAQADGTFAIPSRTATRETIEVSVGADPALGIAAGASADAEVMRKLTVTVTKLGGGRVRLTVTGTRLRPIEASILSETGYTLPGVRAKNVDARGQATFDLGSLRGRFSYYVDAGASDDLFWYQGRPIFRL